MRAGRRIGFGVAVLGLVLGTVQPANAAPPKELNNTTVTLITGDQVTLLGDSGMSMTPGQGREQMTFSRLRVNGHSYVIPTDAQRLVSTGRLDRRLFDVTALVEFGYDDAHRDSVPLIVTGQSVPRAARVARNLPSINGVAMAADKTGAAWKALTTARSGVSTVWLDGKRQSTLDHSAAQIGAPSAWAAGYTGASVTVAVLDTGVDQTHPDLADREIAEQNFSDAPDSTDNAGHGTHVASIVAGTGAKSGGKYRGIADGVSILDGKVLNDWGEGSDSGIIAGMEWAAQQGADIANLSLGAPDTPGLDPVEQAVESLTAEYGILFVVAAGNANPFTTVVASPGSAPSALTVGAVDRDDTLAPFSLTGPTVGDAAIKPDITAPGVNIVAALHSAGTIAPPVEPGYTALSGTSMATPHVAGTAALLAQQHPDWTGQQLKAALSASAKPTAGLTAFEQGAGRVDVARAISETVTTEPSSVSMGMVAWPREDDEPVTKTLTYHNFGAAAVTLALTVEASTDVFSLSANEITVSAGGTAAVTVTGDTRLGTADGAYSGTVVATAGDAVTRTPVGISREEESYDLTLNYVDEHGDPTDAYNTRVVGLDDGSLTMPYDADGSVTVRLPKGRYALGHSVYTEQGQHLNMIAQPGLLLDHDQTVDVDPVIAKPITITLPRPATLGLADVSYQVTSEQTVYGDGFLTNFDLSVLSTAQLGDPLPDTTMTGWVNTFWSDADDAGYALAWFFDRYPNGFTRTVTSRELATVRSAIGPGAPDDKGTLFWTPTPTSDLVSIWVAGKETTLPNTLTTYVNTDVRWHTSLWLSPDFFPIAEFRSPPLSFRPGRTYDQRFNVPVFGPGLPAAVRPWAYRSDNEIYATIPLFTDGGGNANVGYTSTESGSTKLYRDGQLVGEMPTAGFGDFPNLPASPGDYRLTMDAAGPARFSPTTAVSAEWTFRSSQVDGLKALPLNVVRYLPTLDADGTAPAGRPQKVRLAFQNEKGATEEPRRLSVEVSYDEGRTWQRVHVSNLVATLDNPAGATSVSFRASATDRDGNTVKQTVVHAYTLR